jgi:hypothetical protein
MLVRDTVACEDFVDEALKVRRFDVMHFML